MVVKAARSVNFKFSSRTRSHKLNETQLPAIKDPMPSTNSPMKFLSLKERKAHIIPLDKLDCLCSKIKSFLQANGKLLTSFRD